MNYRRWSFPVLAALIFSTLATPAFSQSTRLGPTFTINRLSNGRTTPVRYTDVSWDSVHGVYLVVWGAFGEILGRFVNPDGTLVGDNPFVVTGPSVPGDYKDAPRVEFSPDAGAFMVVWRDNRQDPNFSQIWAKSIAFHPSGTPTVIADDFPVTLAFVSSADTPTLAYSTASREFIVVYNRAWDIRARRYDIQGQLLSSEMIIANSADYEWQGSVVYNPNANEYLVTWRYFSDPFMAGTIQARRVQAGTDESMAPVFNVDHFTSADLAVPTAAYDPFNNRYLVVWYRVVGAFTVAGQMVAADGTLIGERFTVSPTATYVELDVDFSPRMNNYFTVFAHHDIFDIYGVKVSPAGVPGTLDQITVSASVTGTDYGRIAGATDRDEWLVTSNIWWDKAIAQRLTSEASAGGGGSIIKLAPASGASSTSSVTLSWTPQLGATYEVCVDAVNNNACDTGWQGTASTTFAVGGAPLGTYYWQVRSIVDGSVVEANSGTWWSFTLADAPPPPPPPPPLFTKVGPGSGTQAAGDSTSLSWTSAGDVGYWVCWDTTNNNSCDTGWWPNGGFLVRNITELAPGTYYWQVRAQTSNGLVEADGGTWWSVVIPGGTAAPPPPPPPPPGGGGGGGGLFTKIGPASGSTGHGSNVTVSWSSLGDAGYWVCWDTTNNDTCDNGWWPNGGALSRALSGLTDGTYYWQVRGQVGGVIEEADGGAWGLFSVGASAPPPPPPPPSGTGGGGGGGAFAKTSPASGSSGLGSTVTMAWTSLGDAGYWVCWDTTNNNTCDNAWWPNGGGTSRTVTDLADGVYYWQVRGQIGSSIEEANGGTWGSFSVGAAAPPPPPPPGGGGGGGGTFTKVAPLFNAVGLSSSVSLQWSSLPDAGYTVCVDQVNNGACDTAWWPAGAATSRVFEGLADGTYYWQVRAHTSGGTIESDGGGWSIFTVGAAPLPGQFSKLAPGNGSGGHSSSVTLSWDAVSDAGYLVCWDTINNNSCDTGWWPNGAGSSRNLVNLAPGTYYWQVRSATSAGLTDANNGVWFSFTVSGEAPESLLAASFALTPAGDDVAQTPRPFRPAQAVAAIRPRLLARRIAARHG